jgi:hypothetical protein
VIKIAAGAFYTQIFAVRSYGGQGFVAFGSTRDAFCWDIGLLVARGRTEHDLRVSRTRAVFSFEWSFDRVRLGLAPSLGTLTMDRATLSQETPPREKDPLGQFSLGGEVYASADLVQPGGGDALFLRLSLDAEVGAWGPALALGYRFEPAPKARR